jgi:hypothetical protein
MSRTFEIKLTIYATLVLNDKVIDVVDDEWRDSLYNLYTPEDIAEHIGRNFILNADHLSSLDGWADQPDSNAHLSIDDEDITAEEK